MRIVANKIITGVLGTTVGAVGYANLTKFMTTSETLAASDSVTSLSEQAAITIIARNCEAVR